MKSVLYNCVLALTTAFLIGCASPRPAREYRVDRPQSTEVSPTPAETPASSVTTTESQPPHPISATIEQIEINTSQTDRVREVLKFNYVLSDDLTLMCFEAAITTNDSQAQGMVKLEVDGEIVWSAVLQTIGSIADGGSRQYQVYFTKLTRPLSKGSHHFRLLVESDHGVGDLLQGEVRDIRTDKTMHNVVFRWASVLCG